MIRNFMISISLIALSACGTSVIRTSTPKSEDAAEAKSFFCVDQYIDKSLQERPLWEESFEATVTPGQDGTLKTFGVSPGTSKYLAWVGPNANEGIAFMIRQSETGIGATSVATDLRVSENATVIYNVSKDQFFVLSCVRK